MHFRRLTHEDYDDIVKLSKDIWDGADYLPQVFHDWVDAPGYFLGAVEGSTGEVVGTAKFTVLHDGSGWLEGLRVRSDQRGKGIATDLSDRIMQIALEAQASGEVPSIGFSTHVTSAASIKIMKERHFELVDERLMLLRDYGTVEGNSLADFMVEPWNITVEELENHPSVTRNNGIFSYAFVYQRVTQGLIDELKDKGIAIMINGHKGFYLFKGEPNVMALEETFESIDTFMAYATLINEGKGHTEPITYIGGDDSMLNDRLKESGYRVFDEWRKDYFYFVYNK